MLVADSETGELSNRWFASMISEFTGSFVFIFLFMLCTDKKTQYSQDKVINCFIMASAYIAARLMSGGCFVTSINNAGKEIYVGPLLNPALAFGQIIFSWNWSWWYIYPVMPFMGSIAALIFYEFIFVRSQEYLNDDDSDNSVKSEGSLIGKGINIDEDDSDAKKPGMNTLEDD